MKNRRGFLRVIEATIAVLIILGALFVISSDREVESRKDFTDILRKLLDEIAKNQATRERVIEYDLESDRTSPLNAQILANISIFLEERIKNPSFSYSVSICRAEEICYLQEPFPVDNPEDIYAAERIVTTTLSQERSDYSLRKIKIFLWRRV